MNKRVLCVKYLMMDMGKMPKATRQVQGRMVALMLLIQANIIQGLDKRIAGGIQLEFRLTGLAAVFFLIDNAFSCFVRKCKTIY